MTGLVSLTWTELASRPRGSPLLVVPVGSTEQHGPHLPFSTDTDIAVALADGLAARVPDAVVAPAVAYGSSGEHQAFPGTLSIGHEAVELLLVELVRSACLTFPRVVLLSTHGGNAEPVTRAVRRLRSEGRDAHALGPHWAGDAHAGRTETSLMLAIAPHRVNLEAAQPGNTAPIVELLPRLRREGVSAVTANGILGDPAGASAEEGRRLLEQAVVELSARVENSDTATR